MGPRLASQGPVHASGLARRDVEARESPAGYRTGLQMRARTILTVVLGLLIPVALVGGIYLGGHPSNLPDSIRDALVEDEESQLYQEAIKQIEDDYFRPVKGEDLVNRSLEAAVKSLRDQFSTYFDPKSYREFEESTSGEFEGVGMTVQAVKRGLKLLRVFDDSPAKRAGMRAGDIVVAVDGKDIGGESSEQATARIKGEAGTRVKLTWARDGRRTTKEVQRARVDVPVVDSRLERGPGGLKVGHVALSQYSSNAAANVAIELKKMETKGAKAMILDLRGNGGGLLNEAVLLSSLFVKKGVIVSTKGRARPKVVYDATGTTIYERGPLVVLVDGGSASASEITAGALQDHKRATVVGVKTFGKGVFQEVKQLSNGGALDITVGEYFTPKGRNLGGGGVRRGAGIKPDVRASDDPDTKKRDEALQAALRVLARER